MIITKSDDGRYRIGSNEQSFPKSMAGYGKFLGIILECFGFAFAIKDETGKTFYLNRNSAIKAFQLDPNSSAKEIITIFAGRYPQVSSQKTQDEERLNTFLAAQKELEELLKSPPILNEEAADFKIQIDRVIEYRRNIENKFLNLSSLPGNFDARIEELKQQKDTALEQCNSRIEQLINAEAGAKSAVRIAQMKEESSRDAYNRLEERLKSALLEFEVEDLTRVRDWELKDLSGQPTRVIERLLNLRNSAGDEAALKPLVERIDVRLAEARNYLERIEIEKKERPERLKQKSEAFLLQVTQAGEALLAWIKGVTFHDREQLEKLTDKQLAGYDELIATRFTNECTRRKIAFIDASSRTFAPTIEVFDKVEDYKQSVEQQWDILLEQKTNELSQCSLNIADIQKKRRESKD